MKTAIYIENGATQLVLTPENAWETNIVRGLTEGTREVEVKRGQFYLCRGGHYMSDSASDESLILVTKITPTDA